MGHTIENMNATAPQRNESLFENWVRLQSSTANIQSEFQNFELKESQEDWLDLEASDSDLKTQAAAETKAEREYLKKYAAAEYLGHHLAYQDLATKASVEVLEEDGSYHKYRVHTLKSGIEGLTAFALVPDVNTLQATHDIKVVFRGTSSRAGCVRNLEFGGAGTNSSAAARDALLSQINTIVGEFKADTNRPQKPIHLTVAGHSLGGADAQNCFTAIMDGMSQNLGLTLGSSNGARVEPIPAEARNHLNSIQNLRLSTLNSAGVTTETAERSAIFAAYLAEKRNKRQNAPTLEAYNLHVGGDGVQQTGQAHVLSNVPPHHAHVDVLKAHIGSEHHHRISLPKAALAVTAAGVTLGSSVALLAVGGMLASTVAGIVDTNASHRKHLFREPISASYERMSNATPQGQARVHQELNKKSKCLNALQTGVYTTGSTISSAFGRLKSWLTKAPSTPSQTTEVSPLLLSRPAAEVSSPREGLSAAPVATRSWWRLS